MPRESRTCAAGRLRVLMSRKEENEHPLVVKGRRQLLRGLHIMSWAARTAGRYRCCHVKRRCARGRARRQVRQVICGQILRRVKVRVWHALASTLVSSLTGVHSSDLTAHSHAAFRVFGGGHRATVGRGAAAWSSTAGSTAREPDRPEAGGCPPYRRRWRGWPEGTSPHIPPEASRRWLVIEPLCWHPSCYRCGPCPVRLPYGQ
jgi:hypothetical protein